MDINNPENIKAVRDYHLEEMNVRRERQWKVFFWAISLMTTLTAITITTFKYLELRYIEASFIAILQLTLFLFAYFQIRHDSKTALLHWIKLEKTYKVLPEYEDFNDEKVKIPYRIRMHHFLIVMIVFVESTNVFFLINALAG